MCAQRGLRRERGGSHVSHILPQLQGVPFTKEHLWNRAVRDLLNRAQRSCV